MGVVCRDQVAAWARCLTNFIGWLLRSWSVFKLTFTKKSHWTESVIHSFKANKDGNAPFAGVVVDKAGNLVNELRLGPRTVASLAVVK